MVRHHDFVLHTGVGVGFIRYKSVDQWKVPTLWKLKLVGVPWLLKASKFVQKTGSRLLIVTI